MAWPSAGLAKALRKEALPSKSGRMDLVQRKQQTGRGIGRRGTMLLVGTRPFLAGDIGKVGQFQSWPGR